MFIISAGMPKSGSAYFYNLINDILVTSGVGIDARSIKERYRLENVMRHYNNNVGRLTIPKLWKLGRLAREARPFVVKTHRGPSVAARWLSERGEIRVVYSYRDPRDVMLSAIDHGRKLRAEGERRHTFARMLEPKEAMRQVRGWLRIWDAYMAMPGCLALSYESLLEDPRSTCEKIETFLGVALDEGDRQEILSRYSRDNLVDARTEQQFDKLHFNKGVPGRYRTEMTDEQKAACLERFGGYLERMGYALD